MRFSLGRRGVLAPIVCAVGHGGRVLDAFQRLRSFARAAPAVAASVFFFFCAPAQANRAEDFTQDYVKQGLAILNNPALSHDEKHKQFLALLEPVTDMRRVALYAIGPAAKTSPTEQLEAYVKAFHDLELSLYERELCRVQQVKVEASIDRSANDTIVQAFQLDDAGNRSVNADEIDFRVLNVADKPILVDICVRGAWVAVNQRVQYAEFLSQRGNDLTKLIAKLRNRTSKMNHYLAAGEEPPRRVRAKTTTR
jgi:ABC-type transporter MlaC component